MYEKLSRFSFDEISTCKDRFSKNLLQKLNEWIEKRIVLKENDTTYLPDEIKSSFENSFNSLSQTTKQNELKNELDKLDDFDGDCTNIQNQNLILGDNIFNNIINLYNRFKNDKDCTILIEEYIYNKTASIVNNVNKAIRETNHQSFLNDVVLVCKINIELSPIVEKNSVVKNYIEQTEKKMFNCSERSI